MAGGARKSDMFFLLYLHHPTTSNYLNPTRRDPERGLQSWFRPAKPETRNPKPEADCYKVGFELRNPKPETRNRLWRLRTSPGPIETRNPKPETDSEDLTSPGPILSNLELT